MLNESEESDALNTFCGWRKVEVTSWREGGGAAAEERVQVQLSFRDGNCGVAEGSDDRKVRSDGSLGAGITKLV